LATLLPAALGLRVHAAGPDRGAGGEGAGTAHARAGAAHGRAGTPIEAAAKEGNQNLQAQLDQYRQKKK
jgi:hypothetical protein